MSIAGVRHRPKHVPQRTCVGCGASSAKRELVRVVRKPDGSVEPDQTGKSPGRGAYVCHESACWDRAISKGRLERALKTRLSREQRAALVARGSAEASTTG